MKRIYIYDLFCGAGGTTTGVQAAKFDGKNIAEVIACINHDPFAIYSHSFNHQNVKHFTEDIKTFDLSKFPLVERNDENIIALWASLECTNFSNAKGGLPRDPDSRTLAEHLYRYIEYLNPDYILIENVREFMDWGPLDVNRKPIKELKGSDFKNWLDHIQSYGYEYDFRILNSADYGAYTSRRRYFGIFAKEGFPISFPKPTHSKTGKDKLTKWKPVKDVLDLDDHGKSIFRDKPLSEKTYKRIYAGLLKYIAKGDTSILTQYNSGSDVNRIISMNSPCNTVTTSNRFAIINPEFLLNYHHSSDCNDINDSSPTLTTKDKLALVHPDFFIKYFGNGKNITGLDECSPTLTTKDRLALIHPDYFIDCQYSNGKQHQSIEKPSGSLLTVPKEKLITIERFIDEQYGQSKGKSIEEPAGTLMQNPKQSLITTEGYQYLMDCNYGNVGAPIELPCPTILASKRYHYLVTSESGNLAIQIFQNDSEYVKKIKLFMAAYGIIDIKMRMLKVSELLSIQGFPVGYILKGNQTQKKKFIGNAVVPIVAQKWIESLYEVNKDLTIRRMEEAA